MSKLRVRISFDDGEMELTGDAEEVLRGALKFISDVYPTFDLVKNLSLSLDMEEISKGLKGLVAVYPEPMILVDIRRLTASEGCLLALIAKYIAYTFGRSDKPSLSLEEISSQLARSRKSVSARLSELLNQRLIDKIERGKYKIALKGLRFFISDIAPKIKGELIG